MAKIHDIRYNLHYTPPSLDASVNQSYSDKEQMLSDLKDAIVTLLSEDCDVCVENNDGNYLPIELTLRVLDKPSREPIQVVVSSGG